MSGGLYRFKNCVVDLKEVAAVRLPVGNMNKTFADRLMGYEIVLRSGAVLLIPHSDIQAGDPDRESFMEFMSGKWLPGPHANGECDCPCGLKDGCKCGDEE